MFDTNDVYNEAIRGSSLHAEDDLDSRKVKTSTKILSMVLLTSIAYVGFKFYESKVFVDSSLRVTNEFVTQVQTESEVNTVETISTSEEEYLSALRDIEDELTEERKTINLDTSEQMDLSSAMNDLVSDTLLSDNSSYTKELRKEIGMESVNSNQDNRKVIVKKGDTLQGISNKFYGDAMNYKRIIASNESLMENDVIYVGQTINLPY